MIRVLDQSDVTQAIVIRCVLINHHLEANDGTVEVIRIQCAAHETDLVRDDGPEAFPVLADHSGNVEFFPVFHDMLVNPAGLAVEQRAGKAGLLIPG